MGLLTDPGVEGGWLGSKLIVHYNLLAVTLYLCGTAWFLSLAHNSMNHGTYFSENALLPGLVQGEFMAEAKAERYLQELEMESKRYPSSMPHAWLQAKLSQLGLDTYAHNFTMYYPMAVNKSFSGKNVYGILRAMRGSSTESIVVSAPYRAPASMHHTNAPAVALMLALAHFFSKQVYWAKDIIFLFTEHEQLGAEAWLQAYHGTEGGKRHVLDYGSLPARAGPIQAAINLEIVHKWISHIDVRYEGLNGQLPNLDLVNLIHRLCHRENVRHTLHNRHDHSRPQTMDGWLYQLGTLSSAIATQAAGVPNGNHGLYHRYGIAAVTVAGEKQDRGKHRTVSFPHLGRVLEGSCRSLNNLLERFHQSFFFYLLPATNRYISIGVYMPPFGVIGGALLVVALALWCSTTAPAEEKDKTPDSDEKSSGGLVWCCTVFVLVHALCLLLSWCPRTAAALGVVVALEAEDSVAIAIIAATLTLLRLPSLVLRCSSSPPGWDMLKCVAVLELSVLVFAGAVYNFSLALIVTLLYTPVVIIIKPSASRLVRYLKALILLLLHPVVLVLLFVSVDTIRAFPDDNPLKILLKCGAAFKRSIMYSVVDSMVYGNWVFTVACTCLLPVWMLLWQIQFLPHTQPQNKLKTN